MANILTRDRTNADIAIAAEDRGGVLHPLNHIMDAAGNKIDPATQQTLASLLAAVQAQQPGLTDTELRAAPLSVTGTFYQATQPVSFTWAGLTDAQLRASPVDVAVSGTVPVSGTFWQATQPVSFTWAGLTDAQLRASAVPVSAASLPLPSGAATDASVAALQPLLSTIAGTIALHNAPFIDGAPGQLMLAKRRDADTTSVADGDLNTLNLDEEGRLKVASKPASYATITGSVTSATSTVFAVTERFSNLMIHCSGTFAGVNCTFEGSLNSTNGTDGNWFAVQAIRSNANTIETTTGVLGAAPAYAWELSVNALRYFRIRATAWTSGTQFWTLVPGTYATEPIPGAQVSANQPITHAGALAAGTARFGFVASSAIWYDDSAVVLAANATFTGTSRDLTVTATATTMANAATYVKEIRVSAESDQSGTLWVEFSRDNTNWRRAKSSATAAVTGGGQFAEIIIRPSWRYLRVGFTNGATLQTRFTINSQMIAA